MDHSEWRRKWLLVQSLRAGQRWRLKRPISGLRSGDVLVLTDKANHDQWAFLCETELPHEPYGAVIADGKVAAMDISDVAELDK